MAFPRRRELLQALYRAEAKPGVLTLLAASPSLRIAVPCAQLSPAAAGTGSRVAVTIKATHPGGEVLLDCGVYWSGAPPGPVAMHYTALLAHADEDTLEGLASRLNQVTCLTPPSHHTLGKGKEGLAVAVAPHPSSDEEGGLGVATPSPPQGPHPSLRARPAPPPRQRRYLSACERTMPRLLLSSVEESQPRSSPTRFDSEVRLEEEGGWWGSQGSPTPSADDYDASPAPHFNRVFTPPWAAPEPESRRGPALTGRPASDAAARIAAALTHMAAAAPHLAEAMADVGAAHGVSSPLFGQAHDLLNRCLEMKDDAQHALDRAAALATQTNAQCM